MVLALNLAMILALVGVGLAAGSLAVLSAAGDFAADSVALVLGLIAVVVRDRTVGSTGRHPATTVVALVNGAILLIGSVVVLGAAALRLRAGAPPVLGVPVLLVSLTSAVVMALGAVVLGLQSHHEDLHMRSVLLDTVADGAAALAVAVGGAVIAWTHGMFWIDPVLGGLIAVLVAVSAVRLIADAVRDLRVG